MDQEFGSLAAQQCGVVRVEAAVQSLGRGVVRAHLDGGRWQRIHPRVVGTFSGQLNPEQSRWAAVLHGGPGAVLSHATAAEVAGLAGFGSELIHVSLRHPRRVTPVAGVRFHHRRRLPEHDIHPTATPPRTRVERAILDMATLADSDARARAVLAAAAQQRLTTADRLRACLDRQPGVHRRALILQTLADVAGGSHSLPELQFLDLIRSAGLPVPGRQQVRQRSDGRCYLDAHWPEARLTVEIDGAGHLDPRAWAADLDRQNLLVIDGDRVLRFTSADIRSRPSQVAARMRAAYSNRS